MFVLDAEDNRIEAVKDGRVIGYLNYVARDDYIEQHQIFVEEKERRKGIAEGLLNRNARPRKRSFRKVAGENGIQANWRRR